MTGNPPLKPLKVYLYEAQGSNKLESSFKIQFLSSLLNDGIAVHCLREATEIIRDSKDPLCVVGDFNETPEKDGLHFITTQGKTIDSLVSEVKALADGKKPERTKWKPWFPVIDYDRCTNCMQCLTFCLFDVYSVDQGKITVKNEDKCKTDCPACSRVCPEVAILFPKYGKGPINGDVVREDDIKREKMKVDISALLGGDIFSSLRNRHDDAKVRFSRERDESKALKERQRCMKELQEQLDIPDSVLSSLPTKQMIEAKTLLAMDSEKKND
jgi:NAD-dependent dihydropyrimidine dehydrogenase PreA subunit